jgi:hypothetical protein
LELKLSSQFVFKKFGSMATEPPDEAFPTIQISSLDKLHPGANAIRTCAAPSHPVLVVSNIPLYYTPENLCTLLFATPCAASDFLVLLSVAPLAFVALLAVERPAPDLLGALRDHPPTPVCSFDAIGFAYLHSFAFETAPLGLLVSAFVARTRRECDCAICLKPCTRAHPLFTAPCGHVLHSKCLARMTQWECPVCRYAPLSSLGVARCEACGSPDRPLVCLSCGQSFCAEHSRDHFQRSGHGYVCSADGREAWNVISGTYAQRIAYDKSGEFVELCAKEEQLRGYLDGAIEEQLAVHQAVGAQRLKAQLDRLEERKRALAEDAAARRARIAHMREVIGGHEARAQRRVGAQRLLDWLRARRERVARENDEARRRIAAAEAELAEQAQLVRDLEQTVCISGSVALAGQQGKVHIRVTRPP